MNLQLNLIAEAEIRSGSNISKKFLVRIAAVAVPVIMLIVVVPLFFARRQANQNLAAAREEKIQLDPVYQTVVELNERMGEIERTHREMEEWTRSRINWRGMLTELQVLIPSNVQLTRFTVNEKIEPEDGVPARKLLLMMKGRVAGGDARQDIQALDRKMKESRILSGLMSSIDVRLLGSSENPAEPDICMFDATCNFATRKMGVRQPVKKQKP